MEPFNAIVIDIIKGPVVPASPKVKEINRNKEK